MHRPEDEEGEEIDDEALARAYVSVAGRETAERVPLAAQTPSVRAEVAAQLRRGVLWRNAAVADAPTEAELAAGLDAAGARRQRSYEAAVRADIGAPHAGDDILLQNAYIRTQATAEPTLNEAQQRALWSFTEMEADNPAFIPRLVHILATYPPRHAGRIEARAALHRHLRHLSPPGSDELRLDVARAEQGVNPYVQTEQERRAQLAQAQIVGQGAGVPQVLDFSRLPAPGSVTPIDGDVLLGQFTQLERAQQELRREEDELERRAVQASYALRRMGLPDLTDEELAMWRRGEHRLALASREERVLTGRDRARAAEEEREAQAELDRRADEVNRQPNSPHAREPRFLGRSDAMLVGTRLYRAGSLAESAAMAVANERWFRAREDEAVRLAYEARLGTNEYGVPLLQEAARRAHGGHGRYQGHGFVWRPGQF